MDKSTVLKALDTVKKIKDDATFYDLHVHPFEVMHSPFEYHPSSHCRGLFSSDSSQYFSPQVGDLKLDHSFDTDGKVIDKKLRAKLCLLNARRFYPHTGLKVFSDHMNLCGIDRAMLLPVMGVDESGEGQLECMSQMFDDERFQFAYCLPNDIPNVKLEQEVRRVVKKFGVRALKIHPAITGIDLSYSVGINRVEHILDAAEKSGLFVIVHGGLSPDCPDTDAVAYGKAKYLQYVDWALTSNTVIIAHGGLFGHSADDCRETVLPIMHKLFQRYDHLCVDTSGLSFKALTLLLKSFDQQKIYFGSDALYEKQWMAMAKLWLALQKTAKNCDEALVRIVSTNPSHLFVERGKSDRQDNCRIEPFSRSDDRREILSP